LILTRIRPAFAVANCAIVHSAQCPNTDAISRLQTERQKSGGETRRNAF
jgi:hypothetical protein